jgi:hypothetical protein
MVHGCAVSHWIGADDAGIVEIARREFEPQRDEILRNYPWTKSLLSLVVRMAREPVRGAPRSVANLEFHRAGHRVNEICATIVTKLEARGVRAVNPSMGFPMEMYQTPCHAIWVVSHKPVAVEGGVGHMGIHRNLIHPKIRWFGRLTLMETVDIATNVKTFRFRPVEGRQIPFDYLPGQFLTLHVAPQGIPTKRSYTIASTPTWRDRIEVTV